MQVAFEHQADQGFVFGQILADDAFPDHGLSLVFFH